MFKAAQGQDWTSGKRKRKMNLQKRHGRKRIRVTGRRRRQTRRKQMLSVPDHAECVEASDITHETAPILP